MINGNIDIKNWQSLNILDIDDQKIVSLDGGSLSFYDEFENIVGQMVRTNINKRIHGVSYAIKDNSYFSINLDKNGQRYELMNFDDINSTPYIRNGANGVLFGNMGGIIVENGLIRSWSLNDANFELNNITITGIKVTNGFVEMITYIQN